VATLRLFASIREAAATSSVEIDASTVGELVEQASRRFGPAFSELVPTCRVWRNGEPAADDDPIATGDEVALLPPVSGG
jgi:molybdopterin synthase catalytic subunit